MRLVGDDVDGREKIPFIIKVLLFSALQCSRASALLSYGAATSNSARYPEVITLPNHDDNYWPGSENHSSLCYVVVHIGYN